MCRRPRRAAAPGVLPRRSARLGIGVGRDRPGVVRRARGEPRRAGSARWTCSSPAPGVFHATPLDQITAEEWDRIQAVNLKGTFLCCQAALRAMVPQGSGRIVTIASIAGQTGGLAAGASYAASKAGVVGADEVDRPLRRPARHHRELRQPRGHRDADDRDVAAPRRASVPLRPRRSAVPARRKRWPRSSCCSPRRRRASCTAPTWTSTAAC